MHAAPNCYSNWTGNIDQNSNTPSETSFFLLSVVAVFCVHIFICIVDVGVDDDQTNGIEQIKVLINIFVVVVFYVCVHYIWDWHCNRWFGNNKVFSLGFEAPLAIASTKLHMKLSNNILHQTIKLSFSLVHRQTKLSGIIEGIGDGPINPVSC